MNYFARILALAIVTGSLIQNARAADEHVMLIAKRDQWNQGSPATMELKQGDVATLVYSSRNAEGGEQRASFFTVKVGEENMALRPDLMKGDLVIAGPAVVTYGAESSISLAVFKVTRAGTATPPAEVPQEAGSNFDVILEQSSDLVNWTPANPGSYSGTETKRFFRTRIVKKQ